MSRSSAADPQSVDELRVVVDDWIETGSQLTAARALADAAARRRLGKFTALARASERAPPLG